MLAASVIAIFLIPVTFDVVESLTEKFRNWRKSPAEPAGAKEPA
jgi:hypothetical protein